MKPTDNRIEILLLSGYQGSGKDQFGDYLQQHHNFRKVAYADLLREVCAGMFNLNINLWLDRNTKNVTLGVWPFMSTRQILQKIGTDCIRNRFNKDTWVRLTARRIAKDASDKLFQRTTGCVVKYVITDVRYENEEQIADYIMDELVHQNTLQKFKVMFNHIQVSRRDFNWWDKLMMRIKGHSSDYSMFKLHPSYMLMNRGTLEDLSRSAHNIYSIPGWRRIDSKPSEWDIA